MCKIHYLLAILINCEQFLLLIFYLLCKLYDILGLNFYFVGGYFTFIIR